MKDTYNKNIHNALERVAAAIPNSIIRESARGVPHVVINSFYSVVYFFSSRTYNVFSGYATPQNKRELRAVTFDDVVNYFEKAVRHD